MRNSALVLLIGRPDVAEIDEVVELVDDDDVDVNVTIFIFS